MKKNYIVCDDKGNLQNMEVDKTTKDYLEVVTGLKFFESWELARKYRDYIF
jgi:hypothetical protein